MQSERIVIKRNQNYLEIEKSINQIKAELDVIKKACEDKNSEIFPIENIKRLVEKIENLKKKGKDVIVKHDYRRYAVDHKSVYGYFKDTIENANEQEEGYLHMLDLFRQFSDSLEKKLD